jgi:hypothetical protein
MRAKRCELRVTDVRKPVFVPQEKRPKQGRKLLSSQASKGTNQLPCAAFPRVGFPRIEPKYPLKLVFAKET